MRNRPAPGEVLLALLFATLGMLWIGAAARMPLWSGFIPQSGFIPLWYGITLGVDLIGFAPSIFLLLLVLFAAVERLPFLRALVVASAVTAALFLIFHTWLRVPLPVGPLGI
jgi:hypothetical protein